MANHNPSSCLQGQTTNVTATDNSDFKHYPLIFSNWFAKLHFALKLLPVFSKAALTYNFHYPLIYENIVRTLNQEI